MYIIRTFVDFFLPKTRSVIDELTSVILIFILNLVFEYLLIKSMHRSRLHIRIDPESSQDLPYLCIKVNRTI